MRIPVQIYLIIALLLIPNASCKEGVNFVSESSVKSQSVSLKIVPVNASYIYGVHQLNDLCVFSDGSAWGVGYDGQDPRRMFHSIDNGKSWTALSIPSDGWVLNSLFFVEEKHGWAVGNNGVVLVTHDQGQTWINNKLSNSINLTSINFIDANTGVLGGATNYSDKNTMRTTNSAKIFITKDGGKYWKKSYEDNKSEVVKVVAVTEKIFVAWLSATGMIRTFDSGGSWQVILPYQSRLVDIDFTSDKIGFALSDTGEVLKTIDQGETWLKIETLAPPSTNSFWWGLNFADPLHGIAVGDNGVYASTIDGGKSWIGSKLNESDHLRIVRLNKQKGIIIGASKIYSVLGLF